MLMEEEKKVFKKARDREREKAPMDRRNPEADWRVIDFTYTFFLNIYIPTHILVIISVLALFQRSVIPQLN